MPSYGVAQVGGVLTAVYPSDAFTLFDGTETAASGLKSVAFARGPAAGILGDNGTSFFCSGMPASAVIDIQAANQDVDGSYTSVSGSLTPDSNGNASYTDVGRAAFYRAVLTTYVSGAMPKVTAKR